MQCNTWCSTLIWNDAHVSMEKIASLQSHQRINHFTGLAEICKKDRFVYNLTRSAFVSSALQYTLIVIHFDFCYLLARDAFIERIARHDVRPSICPSGTGVHCDHTVHFSADLSLRLDTVG